jgi:hypothetical protein
MTAPAQTDSEWEGWQERLRDELSGLGDGDAVTLTIRPLTPAPAPAPIASRPRRRRRTGTTRTPPPDVFVQARLVAGRLALECIGDTEWEGVTDLTAAQQRGLAALGWERDPADPTFTRTYDPDAVPWSEAAVLLVASLRDVLGVGAPGDVELRRARSHA